MNKETLEQLSLVTPEMMWNALVDLEPEAYYHFWRQVRLTQLCTSPWPRLQFAQHHLQAYEEKSTQDVPPATYNEFLVWRTGELQRRNQIQPQIPEVDDDAMEIEQI